MTTRIEPISSECLHCPEREEHRSCDNAAGEESGRRPLGSGSSGGCRHDDLFLNHPTSRMEERRSVLNSELVSSVYSLNHLVQCQRSVRLRCPAINQRAVRGDYCQNTASRPRAVVSSTCERFSRARSRARSIAALGRTRMDRDPLDLRLRRPPLSWTGP